MSHPHEDERAEGSQAAEPVPAATSAPRRKGWWLLLGGGLVVGVALVVWLPRYLQPDLVIVERVNAFGETERCLSCHPGGQREPKGSPSSRPHPAIAGHEDLLRFGCVPCHGGTALARDASAHAPAVGAGPNPFLPRPYMRSACGRCHIVGARGPGLDFLRVGQRAFVTSSCPGCHRPGAQPRGLGFDLPQLAQRSIADLRAVLLHPRHRLAGATMWSYRDPTYRGRFADTPAGRARLDALIGYILMLGDQPQRQRLSSSWAQAALRVDEPCAACHRLDGSPPKGRPHRCAFLRGNAELRCARCHADKTTAAPSGIDPVRCPQVRAFVFLCPTCHVRESDGATAMRQRALASP